MITHKSWDHDIARMNQELQIPEELKGQIESHIYMIGNLMVLEEMKKWADETSLWEFIKIKLSKK